jgi:hypothetical protein
MRMQGFLWILPLLVFSLPVWACSPPPQWEQSGFMRHEAVRLPKNARGLMFLPPSGKLRARDFQVSSADDTRPPRLKIRSFKGRDWVRLELENGFQPGARYRFRYLPAHGRWAYPDEASVTIGTDTVPTGGRYAIALAPQPVHRTITVMTSSGSCVEPAPAVVQAFTYKLPPALEPYRDVLRYEASIDVATPGMTAGPDQYLDAWMKGPTLYDMGTVSLGWGYDDTYNVRNNAVVAPCGKQWPRARLHAAVSFPEVDELVYRAQDADVDLNRNIQGRCGRVETLVQTIGGQPPEPVLRRLCRIYLAGNGDKPLRAVQLDEWVFQLGYLSNSVSPTCNLVALAYLWRSGLPQPQVLDRIGAALHRGMAGALPTDRDEALHALAYLVDQLPPAQRAMVARRLLGPSRPLLVELQSDPQAARPDELARLAAMSR